MVSGIIVRGMWRENPALVQLLGLCPLLAVSTSVMAGIGLGLATLVTIVVSSILVSALRRWVPNTVRLPLFVVIIASAVTAIDLILPAFLYELHGKLGIFVPLIVTNCVVLARLEAFAASNPIPLALADGFAMGGGFAGALIALGLLREALGTGCILAHADMLLPLPADALLVCGFDGGLFIALTPPGGFFLLAALIALLRPGERGETRDRPAAPAMGGIDEQG